MSNYTQTTFFTPKDSLPQGNPAKTIFGAAYDVEFGNIATAITSKADTGGIASFQSVNVSGTNVPANGIYLPSANTLGFAVASSQVGTWTTAGLTINASLSGSSLNVTGGTNLTAVLITSGNSATTSNGDVIVQRAGSTINQQNQGPNFEMVDTVANSAGNIQWSGNQLEVWQGINADSPVHWQMAFWDANGAFNLAAPRTASNRPSITVSAIPGCVAVYSVVNASIGLAMNSNGSNYGLIQNDGSNLWSLATGTVTTALGTPIFQWNAAGNMTAKAPTSGNTLTVNGVAGGTPLILAPANNAPGMAVNNGGTTCPWISLGSNYGTTGAQTATFSATNKPGSGTTAPSLWEIKAVNGVTYYSPLWQ